ncbi:MAG: glycogen/starch synthase [Paludibacteraceae bacterium]|nr:glycogen/starch synthase [Paludibacteraceae bacterium]
MDTNNYVFEVSWEVCNKVGGIYTVLSTQAKALQAQSENKIIYIGPDLGNEGNPLFTESKTALKAWKKHASENDGLNVKVGTWNIPGKPTVILVDFNPFFAEKNDFLFELWDKFGVDSMNAYGDYDESVVFGYATAKVIESFVKYNKADNGKSLAQFHEWTTASGLLYIKSRGVNVKTLFTTHATTTGRSICFNNKLLYEYFTGYNGDQMSEELGVKSKHAIEKRAAINADCFTTVSDITAKECAQLLEKAPDIVTPNGFEADFVPKGAKYTAAREAARASLKKVAETLTGSKIADDALFVGVSGRYEYRNKGLDVFIEALKLLSQNSQVKREVVAFILVPAWISGPRKDLQEKLENPKAKYQLLNNNVTHDLCNFNEDNVLNALRFFQLENGKKDKVKVVFVPSYLDGADGIFNMSYYDILAGLDITVFASYYEPWGYTPLESAAFGVPTVTTDLSGFGLWVSSKPEEISNGVAVIHRTDNNTREVADSIQTEIARFAGMNAKEVKQAQKNAAAIAKKASWSEFAKYYLEAFEIALKK